jgi:hypothetical protein
MPDQRDPDRPGPLALDILARATIHGLLDDANEVAALLEGLDEPLPRLTDVNVLHLYGSFAANATDRGNSPPPYGASKAFG